MRCGEPLREPIPERSIAWNFLYMLHGREPDPRHVRYFDTCLILYAGDDLDASAFSARVTSSAMSGMYSSIIAAIGTLKGSSHRGPDEEVLRMLIEIGSPDLVENDLTELLATSRRIPGLEPSSYKRDDSRAEILRTIGKDLTQEIRRPELYRISERIVEFMRVKRQPHDAADLYCLTAYFGLGVPIDLVRPVLAMSRVAGWCAHVLEQCARNRVYRPRALYVGPSHRSYVPIEKRTSEERQLPVLQPDAEAAPGAVAIQDGNGNSGQNALAEALA
jgi:citrate synthase